MDSPRLLPSNLDLLLFGLANAARDESPAILWVLDDPIEDPHFVRCWNWVLFPDLSSDDDDLIWMGCGTEPCLADGAREVLEPAWLLDRRTDAIPPLDMAHNSPEWDSLF